MLWPSSCKSALYRVTPGEPRANIDPRVTADGGIVYRVLEDMLLNSTFSSNQSLLLRLGTAWWCWTSVVSLQALFTSATTVSGRLSKPSVQM